MHDNIMWSIAYYDCKLKIPSRSKSLKIFWIDWNASRWRFELLRFQTKKNIESVKTLRFDLFKLLEQQMSLPNRTNKDSHSNTSKIRTNKQNQPRPSSDNPESQYSRARALMETMDRLFSTGLTSANLRLWNFVCSFPSISRKSL